MYSCHYPSCCLHLNCNISLSHLSSCSIPCFVKFRRCLPGCEVLTKFSSCSDAENLIHSFPWNKRRHNGSACAPIHHTLAYRKISFGAWQRCHSSLLTILQINQREFQAKISRLICMAPYYQPVLNRESRKLFF